jgi:hypothetical protein
MGKIIEAAARSDGGLGNRLLVRFVGMSVQVTVELGPFCFITVLPSFKHPFLIVAPISIHPLTLFLPEITSSCFSLSSPRSNPRRKKNIGPAWGQGLTASERV